MFDFKYYAPTKICFGKDSLNELGNLLREQSAKKVLVHYGSNSAIKSGLINKVEEILTRENIPYEKLGGVVPNPRISKVYEGIKICKENDIDFILAVGGGSVIDSSKAIAYGLAYDGDVWDLYEHIGKAEKSFPIGVILTIPAAGSEMSDSSVLTNEDLKEKRGYNSDLCRAKFAIMNPEYTYSLPYFQTMCGATDIMMHTMERYFTSGGNLDLTDEIAEGLLRTVIKSARTLKTDPNNYEARANIMWAGSLSHNNLTECGSKGKDFATHMLEHELSGMFDVAHGAGLSTLWPTWARYVINEIPKRFSKFAVNVMGLKKENETDLEIGLKGISAFEDLMKEFNMPISYSELGINPTDLEMKELASRCAKATGGKKGNAKVLYEEDMYNIYKNVPR